MIPTNNTLLTTTIKIKKQPSLTYKLDYENKVIVGKCDNIEAVKQAILKCLDTERYDEIIYSWNYGTEFKNIYGNDRDLVCSQIQDAIIDALIQDDRITSVSDFEFSFNKKKAIDVKFTVSTIYGDVDVERRVTV